MTSKPTGPIDPFTIAANAVQPGRPQEIYHQGLDMHRVQCMRFFEGRAQPVQKLGEALKGLGTSASGLSWDYKTNSRSDYGIVTVEIFLKDQSGKKIAEKKAPRYEQSVWPGGSVHSEHPKTFLTAFGEYLALHGQNIIQWSKGPEGGPVAQAVTAINDHPDSSKPSAPDVPIGASPLRGG